VAKGFGRNVMFTSGAWLLPAVIAVVAVPITVRGLGPAAYGVLGYVGAVTGYFAVMELGFSSGTTRFLSMFVTKGEGRAMRGLMRFVVAWFGAAGLIGAAAMWVLAPWLIGTLKNVPSSLVPDSVLAFRLGGVGFAFMMLASVFALVPEAFLRYDLLSGVNVIIGSLTFGGPAVIVLAGYGLVSVMAFTAIMYAAALLTWSIIALRLIRTVPDEGPGFEQYRGELFKFTQSTGANRVWSIVQNQTNAVVVGIAQGATQVAFFKVPSIISDRVNELLGRMASVLLPTGSQLAAEGEHDEIVALYERSSRLFFLLNAAATGVVVVFAIPLLSHWIGPRYAVAGAAALSLLTLAQCINATSMSASLLNLSLGRPRVNLVASVINSIINLGTVYFLTVAMGITGTALSGFLAALVVPFFLWYTHRKVLEVSTWVILRDCYLRTIVAVTLVCGVSYVFLRPLASNLFLTLVLAGLTGAAGLAAAGLIGAVTRDEWDSIKSAARTALRRGPAEKVVEIGGGEAASAVDDGLAEPVGDAEERGEHDDG
jgi:O-antigen/teichoic acid export membrane protein